MLCKMLFCDPGLYNKNFCYFSNHQQTLTEDSKMKILLFLIGLLLLSAVYLWAVENCRPVCVMLWGIVPAYILAGLAIMEGK
jgi:hypothetical protein